MTIAKRPPLFIHGLLLAGVISLAACGGSSGSKKPVIDTTPNAITFIAADNVEPNISVTSSSITISGINAAAPISIIGGEYSINGGAFTAAPGTITEGQTLAVRVTSSEKTYTPKEAVVKVGEVTAKFTVTTFADVTPEAFTFTPVTEAALDKEYASSVVTVKGIDVAVPVSINGGVYSINGGAFTSAAGTVSADQTITVKVTSAPKTDTTKTAVLTIGGITGSFAVSTFADKTPPVAEFKFPTPYTMSEADEVKVRGIATDDNAITEVKLLVRSYHLDAQGTTLDETEVVAVPASETDGVKDFSSWTATIPLTADAENEITVIATDEKNNVVALEEANKVVIRQADVSSAFPDEENQFDFIYSTAIDMSGNHKRLLAAASGKILRIDLETGLRSLFIDHRNSCDGYLYGLLTDAIDKRIYGYCNDNQSGLVEFNTDDGSFVAKYPSEFITKDVFGVALDRNNGRSQLVLVEQSWSLINPSLGGNVVLFSTDTKNYSVLYRADQEPIIHDAEAVIVDGNRYLITVGGQNENILKHKVVSVDASTGLHTVITDNEIGSGEPFNALLPNGDIDLLKGIALDKKRNVLFVNEMVSGRLFALDLSTNHRFIFKHLAYENTEEPNTLVYDIDMHDDGDYLVLTESGRKSILIIDAVTSEKVILSKSKNDF